MLKKVLVILLFFLLIISVETLRQPLSVPHIKAESIKIEDENKIYLPYISYTSRIQRIEIIPGSLLLTQSNETRLLNAQAYGYDGNPIVANFIWVSSHPEQVSINASGQVTSLTLVGSAQITASAEGVTSTPILITIGEPTAGTILINDEQIVSQPELVQQDNQSFAQYKLTLEGDIQLFPDILLLGTGDIPLAGKVISSQFIGNNTEVILQTVPLSDMFQNLSINETFNINELETIVGENIPLTAQIESIRNGKTTFSIPEISPKITSIFSPNYEWEMGPFECESSSSGNGIFSQDDLITIEVIKDLDLDMIIDINNGELDRFLFILEGTISASMSGGLHGPSRLEGAVNCKAELYRVIIPVGGYLTLFIRPEVILGLGFGAEGTITDTQIRNLSLEGFAGANLVYGFDYHNGIYETFEEFNGTHDVSMDLSGLSGYPSGFQFHFQSDLYFYGFAELAVSAFLFDPLTIIEAQFGPKFEADLSYLEDQAMGDTDPSYYMLFLHGNIGLGEDLTELFQRLSGQSESITSSVGWNIPLSESPKGELLADKLDYVPYEDIVLTVDLDPETLSWPFIDYNVDRVDFYRFCGECLYHPVSLLGSIYPEEDGQVHFKYFPWKASDTQIGEQTFFAFVRSKVLTSPLLIASTSVTVAESPFPGEVTLSCDTFSNLGHYNRFEITASITDPHPLRRGYLWLEVTSISDPVNGLNDPLVIIDYGESIGVKEGIAQCTNFNCSGGSIDFVVDKLTIYRDGGSTLEITDSLPVGQTVSCDF